MTKRRSRYQNRLYWHILGQIAEQLHPKGQGFSNQTWAEYFKQRYLGSKEVLLPNGKTITALRSTADLTTDEFSEYLDKIMAWSVEHGVNVPSLADFV